ncbi:unnamed protein product [Rotaria sordida]|uniref:Mutator-like transposase domain-containing protein n=1 Tax=Rotaria sordida TaxID=392033 RepID=A0A814T7D6_9BILA|nr:unnamed protein product [Rotaria sordida]
MNSAHVCSKGRLQFIPDVSSPVGLFHQNVLRCSKCLKETLLTNFPPIQPIESEQQEPNKCLSIAAAANGIRYTATKWIFSSLGLSITTQTAFLRQLHKNYDALHDFAKKNMQLIIDDIKHKNNKKDEIMDITISLDGTWKTRGHTSKYGVVFIIDVQSGYCIDYEVLSLNCEVCNLKKTKLKKEAFNKWYKSHQKYCYKNYSGSSKSMEKEGTIRLFQRSLTNGLRYKRMVCDGDASAYETIKHYYLEQQHLKEAQKESEEETIDDFNNEESKHAGSIDTYDEESSSIDACDEEPSNIDDYDDTDSSNIDDNEDLSTIDDDDNEDPSTNDDEESSNIDDEDPSIIDDNEDPSNIDDYNDEESSNIDDDEESSNINDDEDPSNIDDYNDEESSNIDDDEESSNIDDYNDEANQDKSSDSSMKIHKDLLVVKEDCINHIAKRAMKYLTKLKREKTRQIPIRQTTKKLSTSSSAKKQPTTRQQLLDDNKKWGGGVGRMTQHMMEKLSKGYGLAIRQASTLAAGMQYNRVRSCTIIS